MHARTDRLRSAPAEAVQATPPTPEFKVADATPVLKTRAAVFVPSSPVVPMSATDQLTPAPSHPGPGRVGDTSGDRGLPPCRLPPTRLGRLSHRR